MINVNNKSTPTLDALLETKQIKPSKPADFYSIEVGLASSATIRSWSYGKVKKPETINYRTFKPERDGLFCERIFGPTKDYECFCGKYKGIRYKGVICDRCGVEITTSDVRRRRMGHIELACPIAHIWFFKIIPSPMALLLDISSKDLERVIYFEAWIVTDPGNTPLQEKQILSDMEYRNYQIKYGAEFKAKMGAEAIKELLKKLDLKKEQEKLRKEMKKEQKFPAKKIKRLEVIEAFLKSDNQPEWMILDVLPVIPPELRPMVQLEGGRFASSDLNDLYRRVINRNNRLEKLIELKAPEIIIRNEKRMLQEAVDALFDNSRRRKPIRGTGNRPLKSLSDMLKGKQGRFRQNLLGKRVDYSGRSVIVVDPKLKLHQCGLPKRMALELFKPFVVRKLVEYGLAHNIKTAKRQLEQESDEIWKLLKEIVANHTVLLNRAPTLHRLGIQAFEPILIEEDAIKIHPLVCTAFNADFDGDQMAVHVPLSVEAQLESKVLMLSSYNLLSPAHGKPLGAPTHDMVLGLYYLTQEKPDTKKITKYFGDYDEVKLAYEEGIIDLHEKILFRLNGKKKIETTAGRVVFNQVLPEKIRFVNEVMDKKKLNQLISKVFKLCGNDVTVEMLDKIKELGFSFATRMGATIALDDMIIPKAKTQLIEKSNKEAELIQEQYQKGVITEEERYNKTVDLWTYVVEELTAELTEELKKDKFGFNPIHMMVISGARGNKQQIRQLCGMRGLMAKPSGEIIELPITSNFREGLSVLEYFISTHGARKGLADTALKTADAGYFTRRLVDVAQDVVITQTDCGTLNGVVVEAIKAGDEIIEPLADRILGRVALDDIVDPRTGKLIVKANEEIDEEAVEKIIEADIERVRIRSVFTCETRRGICTKCYGRNLATGKMVDIGEAIGIIAAQSIGEPGTQLTMRTFHIGGTAYRPVEERELKLPYKVVVVSIPRRLIKLEDNLFIVYRQGELVIRRILFELEITPDIKPIVFDGLWVNVGEKIAKRYIKEENREEDILTNIAGMVSIIAGKILIVAKERNIVLRTGTKLRVVENQIVEEDTVIAEMDPYNEPILTEVSGRIKFQDIVVDSTLREELDENTGLFRRVIVEDKEGKLQPRILIYKDEDTNPVSYIIPHGARLVVNDGDVVKAGDALAKFPQELIRTKDITGGLPRVIELFEARKPKNMAVVSEIDGIVKFKELPGGRRLIIIENPKTKDKKEYEVSLGRHLRVHEGDEVYAGSQLTDGEIAPQDILRIKGEKQLQQYLLAEIQEVYRLQRVEINDKHIEVIIRQMLRKVNIIDPGDTDFLAGELVDRFVFTEHNEEVIRRGGRPATARTVLLGITKASLLTDSFISSASFQETTRVLTDAAISGKKDNLLGLKENVIIGKLIPAGTGLSKYREVEIITKDLFQELFSEAKPEESTQGE